MAVKQLIRLSPAETPYSSCELLDEQSRMFDMFGGEKKRKTVFRQKAEKRRVSAWG